MKMEVLLDTNFVISCVIKKIDFISNLEKRGFKTVVPREVIQELKDLKLKSKISHQEREAIDIALQIFSSKKIKKTTIGKGKVDDMLIKKGEEGIYIATLDAEIKRKVPNKIVILNAKNEIGVERD